VNEYSSEAEELQVWIDSVYAATKMIGANDVWNHRNDLEQEALKGLRRYAFAKSVLKVGQTIDFNSVFFAIPGGEDQFQSNAFSKYSKFEILREIKAGEAISSNSAKLTSNTSKVSHIRQSILSLLKESNVTVPSNAELEISHHFGLDHFESVGMSMITVVNREYCKKLLILLPGQRHPAMYHKVKDETFFLLHGDITLLLDDVDTPIELGETVHIQPGVVHEFWTKNGAIIEEVSSNHSHTDSFYIDEKVSQNLDRKTFVKYWS
jgi:quercetin dioxygenase-like cupin family protein